MRHLLFALILLLLTACTLTPPPARVLVEVDGARLALPIGESQTVGELLRRAEIRLGAEDRVEPPSFTLLAPDMRILVIRVSHKEVTEAVIIPFGREVRRDASLPQGESRLLQLGQNGSEQITLRITSENGLEVGREIVTRQMAVAPTDEVFVLGTRGTGVPVAFEGTVVYLQGGNAWLMREDSQTKIALTETGDLDGHVFALSPDGRWLLFTREPLGGASGQGGPLNSLWWVDTRIVNEAPRPLDIDNVLWAGWQPCATGGNNCPLQVAYSTATRVPTPPGWRAHNDLYRFGLNTDGVRGDAVPVLAAQNGVYGWWGRSWAWSPDGGKIAWADATTIGVVYLSDRREQVVVEDLPLYETGAAWVWVPQLAWSPNSRYLTATVHRADVVNPQSRQRRPRFDLLRFDPAQGDYLLLEQDVGPFANPTYIANDHLLFAQVEDPANPLTSRYLLMNRRGTARPAPLFPATGLPALDIPIFSVNSSRSAILTVWQEDLYMIPLAEGTSQPLTSEGGTALPQWGH